MNESTKTLAFIGVAAVSLIAAAATSRSTSDFDIQSRVGEKLKDFDPIEAKQLKIVDFDEDTATLSEFEVAQDDDGIWSLESKNGYPADAERQMGEAAGSLLDREILAIASESAADHELYGVVDPASPKLEVGQKGVGRRVTLSDINDEPLVDLIVGKEVKGAEGQRYVREANRDFVYAIEIDPSKLTANFTDWIESDLLKLNAWDIGQVAIEDYSFELVRSGLLEVRPDWQRRGRYTLRYDEEETEWQAVGLKTYDEASQEYVDAPLTGDEQLNTEKLNEMKRALDELEIVDVEKKPSGLTANLKAGEGFLNDEEGISSLFERGFTVVQGQNEALELLSSEGEVTCTMNNGVEYVLRFGDLQASSGNDNSDDAANVEDVTDSGVNRYLFVMVRMNEDAVDKPELEELPELPAGVDQSEISAAAEADSDEAGTEATENDADAQAAAEQESGVDATTDQELDAEADSNPESDSENPDDATDSESDSATGSEENADSETPSTDGEEAADEQAEGEADAEDADADEADSAEPGEQGTEQDEPEGDETAADQTAEDEAAGDETAEDEAAGDEAESDDTAQIIQRRKEIEEENQRKLDEYQQKLEEGRQQVEELNVRFGDWYYVISNNVFRKIHLTRDDLVQEKQDEAPGGQEAAESPNAGQFGAPGAALPGIPGVPNGDEGQGEPADQ